MHSCIYEGQIRHRRFGPIKRSFAHRLFLVYVDLAELDALFGRRGLWSSRGPALARFRRADHLGAAEQPLDDAVRALVEARLGWRPRGPIRLLTHFRYLGFAMNPVSFYYCFDPEGQRVEALVAEVNNTPWGEQHAYVVDLRRCAVEGALRARLGKEFHVSPFLPMELDYRWRLTTPGERLTIHIECIDATRTAFDATLALRRTPITRWRLAALLVQYPLMTLRVFLGIYWQALLIWRRGVRFYPHPGRQVTDERCDATDPSAAQTASEPQELQV